MTDNSEALKPPSPDRWMTYTELSSLLEVSLEAAKRRAGRGGWPRQLKNDDGRARVLVPGSVLDNVTPKAEQSGSAVVGNVVSNATHNKNEEDARLTARLQAEIEGLKRVETEIERLRVELNISQSSLSVVGTRAAVAEEAVKRLEETLREIRAERDRPGWLGRILVDVQRGWQGMRDRKPDNE